MFGWFLNIFQEVQVQQGLRKQQSENNQNVLNITLIFKELLHHLLRIYFIPYRTFKANQKLLTDMEKWTCRLSCAVL